MDSYYYQSEICRLEKAMADTERMWRDERLKNDLLQVEINLVQDKSFSDAARECLAIIGNQYPWLTAAIKAKFKI